MSVKYFVGIDIGGSNLKIGIVDESGKVLFRQQEAIGLDSSASACSSSSAATITTTAALVTPEQIILQIERMLHTILQQVRVL